tara:strand:- start:47419 stop:48096 length:678 start_codon:yes stop_codon:yes gene_type:complete
VWFLFWTLSYLYIDKIILFFLGAIEIIENDFQELFQQFKSETYKRFEKQPKIYLYSGKAQKCFIFESRGEWSIVLDRKLAAELDAVSTKALVEYLVTYKKTSAPWRITKSLGIVVLTMGAIYSFWSKILLLDTNSKVFKVVSLFSLALFRPFFDAALAFGRSAPKLECDNSLAPVIHRIKDFDPDLNYGQFIFDHLQENINPKSMMISYMESFPVIENAVLKRSF